MKWVKENRTKEERKEVARMGALAKNRLHPNVSWQFKKNDERTRQIKESASKGYAAFLAKNPNHYRDMGRKSRLHENKVAAKLKADYIFKPNEVCDRIVIRNGAIFFVEIKQPGRKLTEKQAIFQHIVGGNFQVVYS